MKKIILTLTLLLSAALVMTAQTSKPSVFQVYKVFLYSPITETIKSLDVDYPVVISDGVVSFDNAGDESYRVTQSTVRQEEVGDATIIYSRGVDQKGRFVTMKLYLSPKKAYLQVTTASGYISSYYFTTY